MVSYARGESRELAQAHEARSIHVERFESERTSLPRSRKAVGAHLPLAEITRGCLMCIQKSYREPDANHCRYSEFAMIPEGAPTPITVKGELHPRAKPQVKRFYGKDRSCNLLGPLAEMR